MTLSISRPGTYLTTTGFTYFPAESKSLSIIGAGAGSTILDGQNTACILTIYTSIYDDINTSIYISSMTFQNGRSPGSAGGLAVFANSANISVGNSVFSNNTVDQSGGLGRVAPNTGVLLPAGAAVDRSIRIGMGQGIGGGAGITSNGINGTVAIHDCIFNGNSFLLGMADQFFLPPSCSGGAGIFSAGFVVLERNTFTNNSADFSFFPVPFKSDAQGARRAVAIYGFNSGGGAKVTGDGAQVIFANNIFSGNTAVNGSGGGAGISSLSMPNGIYRVSGEGGGARISLPSPMYLTLINNTFTGNSAVNGAGGGLFVSLLEGTVDIYNNIIWGNSAGISESSDFCVFSCPPPDLSAR